MTQRERGDYADRLDDAYWDYVDRVDAFFPSAAPDLPLDEQRRIYDRMCRAFHPGRPADVEVSDRSIRLPGRLLSTRRYRPRTLRRQAVVLFLHGGGFVFGGLDSHDDTAADLCACTGLEVMSVDYRLAPEHTHPAAFDDAFAAFEWLREHSGGPVVLAGESAGGTLAAAVCHAARGRPGAPVGQLLIYPWLGGEPGRSHREHAFAPLLTNADLAACRRVRSGGRPPVIDARFEPLTDLSFADLPPSIIVTAQCDPLSSEGESYRDRILAAGGQARWREEPRLTHSFLRARPTAARAREAFLRIVVDLAGLVDGFP